MGGYRRCSCADSRTGTALLKEMTEGIARPMWTGFIHFLKIFCNESHFGASKQMRGGD